MSYMFYALENKRLDKNQTLESTLDTTKEKIHKLEVDNIGLIEQRDQVWSDANLFQKALKEINSSWKLGSQKLTLHGWLLKRESKRLSGPTGA